MYVGGSDIPGMVICIPAPPEIDMIARGDTRVNTKGKPKSKMSLGQMRDVTVVRKEGRKRVSWLLVGIC